MTSIRGRGGARHRRRRSTHPQSDVGDGIVTATVRSPDGSIVGLIRNPHFQLSG